MDERKLKKLLLDFHGPGGRYSYFPSQHDWAENFESPEAKASWNSKVQANIVRTPSSPLKIDLYIHIPFCEQLCTFCGCNIAVTKDHQVERPYIDLLLRELDYDLERLGPLTLNSLYLGGGTPNFLSAENVDYLLSGIFSRAMPTPDFYGSVELDPRRPASEFLHALAKHNIKRFFVGIQDLDNQTMTNVNRPQNLLVLEKAIHDITKIENHFLSGDLIYGLPLQTQDQLVSGINQLSALPFHAMSFYPLAQAFWQKQHQVAFGQISANSPETMIQLFLRGDAALKENNFQALGFGHYFREQHPDAKVLLENRGSRNVSGFSPVLTPNLLGLGVGAISTFPNLYWQNQRILEQYKRQIGGNVGYPERAHLRSDIDCFFGNLFERIVCQKIIPQPLIEEASAKYTPAERFVHHELLAQLLENKILTADDNNIQVSELGIYFLKSICQAFDPYFLGRQN